MIGDLATDRLLLRPLRRSDVDLLLELDSDSDVMRYLTGRPSSRDEVQREVEDSLGGRWLVFDGSDVFLGWVGAVPNADGSEYDIGWRFRRGCWGNGFATEAALGLVAGLFSEGARRVFAQTMAVNHRSRSVMERVGMRYSRTFHLELDDPLPGTERGEVEYDITRDEWNATRGHLSESQTSPPTSTRTDKT